MSSEQSLHLLTPASPLVKIEGGAAVKRAQRAALSQPAARRIQLIVNADDFGASEEVNEAIIRAHLEGVLTSASLMVTGPAFEGAVRLARQNPTLAVGIHLVAAMGRAALSRAQIPSLVDERGNFSDNPTLAGLRYFFSRRARRELRLEIAAQFDRFRSTGLKLSHVDGHLHMHVHPVIFKIALDLGARHGARRMRVPVEERRLAVEFDRSRRFTKTIQSILFARLGRYMKKRLDARGFIYADRVYGNLQSGQMDERYFLHALNNLSAWTNEIYFHPALYEIDRILSADEHQCQIEFEALTSGKVRQQIEKLGFKLTNYFDLKVKR
jgi:hopanoid biosynthesis associated protein HpnK